jgi:18S rRNA (guanine1575-N7)-methyltransferase
LNRLEKRKKKGKASVKSKDWVLEKKERRRQEGRETRDDSKYTARRRPGKF